MSSQAFRSHLILVTLSVFLLVSCVPAEPQAAPTAQPSSTPEPLQRPSGAGGGLIVFASDRSGNNMDLFLINADGSGLIQLTDSARDEIAPAWSPGGTRIAVLVHLSGTLKLGTLELDPFPASPISEVQGLSDLEVDEAVPSWSPDGAWILVSASQGENRDLFVVAADGSGQIQLTETGSDEYDPAWSPAGDRIAYISDQSGEPGLYLAQGSDPESFDWANSQLLVEDLGDLFQPSWSPDGTRLAFFNSQGGNKDLYLINADGTGLTRLTDSPAEEWNPRWSADGERLAYSYFNFNQSLNDLIVLDPETGTETPLTSDNFDNWWPDWTR